MEAHPLGWKLLQRAPKHFPCTSIHFKHPPLPIHPLVSLPASSTSTVQSPQTRRLCSDPKSLSHLSSAALGICILDYASLGQPGAKAPASSVAMTWFACAEPARLIHRASRGQLAGIFASFNSQSSQEPGEGLSTFTEMKGRREGQIQALKRPNESSLFPNIPLSWRCQDRNNIQSGHFSGQQSSGTASSSHPACKQHGEALWRVPAHCKQMWQAVSSCDLGWGGLSSPLSAAPWAQRCPRCGPVCEHKEQLYAGGCLEYFWMPTDILAVQ